MSRTPNEIRDRIEGLEMDLNYFRSQMQDFEPDISDSEFEEYLDDIHEEVCVGNICWPAGRVLLEMDPIAFNEAKNDYLNSLDPEEFEEYRDLQSDEQSLIDELEEEEEALEEAEAQEEEDEDHA